MLVIEGKSGKSRVLAHYIDGLYKRTINSDLLIIDSVGISHVSEKIYRKSRDKVR